MGSTEKSHSTYLYSDGTTDMVYRKGPAPLVTWWYEENDGARFLRRGAERTMEVTITRGIPPGRLERIVERSNVPQLVKDTVKQMLSKGEYGPRSVELDE
jgi:hypothetical protein